MPLHAAAELVADRIRSVGNVEIIAHHDADGIAAGAILAMAMARAGLRFRIRIRGDVRPGDLDRNKAYLLCDIGAGIANLPEGTMVVDHHEVHFDGEYHVNPRLAGINGDRDLSGSGTAYLVAGKLGDNRDLAGLALLGVIGDRQEFTGMNRGIYHEGVAHGIITPARGFRLPGRDLHERLVIAAGPIIDGISGNDGAVGAITGEAAGRDVPDLKKVISLCVMSVIRNHTARCAEAVYGDTCVLPREVIPDAHSLAAVIDACGKTGHGDLGVSLCLRHARDADAAWEIARKHRLNVIAAFRAAAAQEAPNGFFEVENADLASDIADELACRSMKGLPVAVIARDGSSCRISARCPEESAFDLGTTVRNLAQDAGGTGGGHRHRAGATIPCDQAGAFKKGWAAAVTA